MRGTFRILSVVALFLTFAQRAPAPIREVEESPAPTPAVKTAKEATSRPKPKSSRSPGDANSRVTRSAQVSPFSGKWVGTMPEVPWGNVATELIVDQTGTTMTWQESGKHKGVGKTQVNGNTLSANFFVGVAETWSLTLQTGGSTARVRLQAVMNDQTAVFHRVAK